MKKIVAVRCLPVSLLGFALSLAAQNGNPATYQSLRITETRNLPLNGALVGNARCDTHGNMYFRIADDETPHKRFANLRLSIRKMDSSGTMRAPFQMPNDPPDLLSSDFFVTTEGSIYLAAHRLADQSAYVVKFAPDGKRTVIGLDNHRFRPRQIVVFRSGEMLLSGTQGPLNHTPFTGLFAADGKFLRKIYEPEDEQARVKAEALDPDYVYQESDNTTVVHGDAALGSDGNAYLLRAVTPALIFVISAKGEVLRKLQLESPAPELLAQRLHPAKGSLAVSFLLPHSSVGRVRNFDLDGNVLSEVTSNETTTNFGLPACYDGTSFAILHVEDNGDITLRKAEAK